MIEFDLEEAGATRVFLCDLDRYSADEQLKACRKFAKLNGLPAIGRRVYYAKDMAAYVNDLRRDEIALVARLDVLKEHKGKGVKSRLYRNAALVAQEAYVIWDIAGKIRSDDAGWADHLDATAKRVSRSRPLSADRSKAMQHAKDHEGLVEKWKGKEGDKDYIRAARVWGNMAIKPALKARNALPKELRPPVSERTIRRIFRSRRKCAQWLNDNT